MGKRQAGRETLITRQLPVALTPTLSTGIFHVRTKNIFNYKESAWDPQARKGRKDASKKPKPAKSD
jgi:hypothetical protein